ncbi:MAG TPA: peptidylprolyl isomerase, partial [Chitinophagaceae bacterium]|nr:peptidylprolyl isomerase [Chitinophagaceae bacterium]
MKKITLLFLMAITTVTVIGQKDSTLKKKDYKKDVLLETSMGDMVVRLSDSTPLHRDNFLKLVKMGYYDGILFHRV